MKAIIYIPCLLAIGCAAPKHNPPQAQPTPSKPIPPGAKFEQLRVKYIPPARKYSKEEMSGVEGTVVVTMLVGTDGKPSQIKAIEGPVELYKLAEDYVVGWEFYPALVDGKPYPNWFKATLPFKLGKNK